MKNSAVPLAIMMAMGITGSACAMYETGGITGIDVARHFITLDSRVTYSVSPKVDMSGLTIGEHVRFDTETRNGRPVINKIFKDY